MFKHFQIRQYGLSNTHKEYQCTKDSLDFIQKLKLEKRLDVHSGCVNTVCWNDSGSYILSGSDDKHLVVTDPFTGKIVHRFRSGHRQNIFSAKFLPNTCDRETVSCSGDGKIFYSHLEREDLANSNMFDCHYGTAYEVLVIPNEASTFLSCGEDGTVRFFDLRAKTSCKKPSCKEDVMISCRSSVSALSASPVSPWQLAIGCSDSSVRIYDRRMLGTRATGNYQGKGVVGLLSMFKPPGLEKETYRITSLNYSHNGKEVLVSYSLEQIYLFEAEDTGQMKLLRKELPTEQSRASKHELDQSDARPSSSDPTASSSSSSRVQPVKRLRLRGDWSDTGPRARPERERRTDERGTTEPRPSDEAASPEARTTETRTSVMNRMSVLLTRWFNRNMSSPEPGDRTGETEAGQDGGQTESQHDEQTAANSQPSTSNTSALSVTDNSSRELSPNDSRSDESQGSVVTKIESMDMNDSISGQGHSKVQGQSIQGQTEGQSHISEGQGQSAAQGHSQNVLNQLTEENLDSNDTDVVNEAEGTVNVYSSKEKTNNTGETDEIMDTDSTMTTDNDEMYNPLNPTSYSETRKHKEETSASNRNETDTKETHQPCEIDKTETKPDDPSNSLAVEETENLATHSESDSEHTDTECHFDQTSYSAERSQFRSSVLEAVQTLKRQNLEPVVSLHYSSEGTSAGTIRVRFAQLDDMQNEVPEPNPGLRLTRVTDNNRFEANDGANRDGKCDQPNVNSPDEMAESNSEPVEADDNPHCDTFNSGLRQESDEGKTDNSDVAMEEIESEDKEICDKNIESRESAIHEVDGINEPADLKCDHSEQLNTKSAKVDAADDEFEHDCDNKPNDKSDACASEIDNCRNERPVHEETSDRKVESSMNESEQIIHASNPDASDSIKLNDVHDELGNVKVNPNYASVNKECDKATDSSTDSKDNSAVKSSDGNESRGDNPGTSAQAAANTTPPPTPSGLQVIVSDDSDPVQPESYEQAEGSQRNNIQGVQAGARYRQRRYGHSGPPTGNFQLYDNDNSDSSSSSSSDNEPEGDRAAARRRALERNTAALKLQAFHRLCQESKEKKELENKNVYKPMYKQKYRGHRNARTMIKESNFWGENYIMSGSDCGHIFVWDKHTAKVVMILEADKHVVNCIQPNPYHPILATSGIDYDIKIWSPLSPKSGYSEERIKEVMERNEIMLEETRDTLTVPTSFMLRVLASINNIQSGRRAAERNRRTESEHTDSENE